VPDSYRIFDASFGCGFDLPELPDGGPEEAEFHVVLENSSELDLEGFETRAEWPDSKGEVALRCSRRGQEYLLDFPARTAFLVTPGRKIACLEAPGTDRRVTRHLLLNQALPRYLGSGGRMIVHCGAVTLATGRAVGFLGQSGRGKSTLVADFHRHGARLIDDDAILLQVRKDGVWALGGYPGIRLFPDSVNAVFEESSGFTNYTPYSDKQQVILRDEVGGVNPWYRLDALFVLNGPGEPPAGDSVEIEPLPLPVAVMNLEMGLFSLDPTDRVARERGFGQVCRAASEGVGVYRLAYPRAHERLAEVRWAVEEFLAARPTRHFTEL